MPSANESRTEPPSFVASWRAANSVPLLFGSRIGVWLWPLLLLIATVWEPAAPPKKETASATVRVEIAPTPGVATATPPQAVASQPGSALGPATPASSATAPCASLSPDIHASWQGCLDLATVVYTPVASVLSTVGAPLRPWLQTLSGLLTALMLLRTLLWRHLYRAGTVNLVNPDEERVLLPSQQVFVNEMVQRLSTFSLSREGPLWALEGRWGEGKSHIAESIRQTLETKHPDVAAVYIHIWREQTADNLHLAIVEAVLRHPRVLELGFAGYPVSRMLARKLGHWLQHLIPDGWQFSQDGITAKLDPRAALPLYAQRDLEQVVAYLRVRGKRIVLVLDEIDRSTPEVAQAALVLSRRALNLPGLAVLMPFVGEQLEQKVANPLLLQTPDLMSTFIAQVQHQRPIRLLPEATSTAAVPTHIEQHDAKSKDNKASGSGQTHDDHSQRTIIQRRQADFERRVLEAYSGYEPRHQRHLVRQTLEKYLSLRALVPALSFRDLPHILRFESVGPLLPRAVETEPAETMEAAMKKALEAAQAYLRPGQGGGMSPPAVRHLEGRLVVLLTLSAHAEAPTQDGQAGHPATDPGRIAALTALAWRSAQVLQARWGEVPSMPSNTPMPPGAQP